MRVPVQRTPRTNPSSNQQGYIQGGQGLDYSPIIEAVRGFARDLEQEKDKAEEFELNKKLLDETLRLQTDFDRRTKEAPLGASEFTNRTLDDWEGEHVAILDELQQQGYNREGLQNFALRLGSLRESYGQRALAFQGSSVRALADSEFSQYSTKLSQLAADDPNSYDSAIEELRDTIWKFPGLTEEEREERLQRESKVILNGASKALAIQNPDLVIAALDPQGHTAPARTVSGGAHQIIQGLDEDRGSVANTLSAAGFSGPVVAGFLGNFDIEGGYGGAQGDGGSASGIAQWRLDRRDNFRAQFGKEPHEATKAEQAQFVIWEMQNPAEAGMSVAERDAILAADTPEKAAELIDKHYERSSGEHRQQRLEAAAGYGGSIQTIDPGAGTSEQAPEVVLPEGEAVVPPTHPVLERLTGEERLQVLGWAREQKNRSSAQMQGALDVAVENAVNAWLTEGEYAGPALTEDMLIEGYGEVAGRQKWAQVSEAQAAGQAIQRMRTMSPADINAQLEGLRPEPGSETYTQELKMFQAAQRAAGALEAQREKDPAAYVLSAFPEVATSLQEAETSEQRQAAFSQMRRAFEQLDIPENEQVYMTDDMLEATGARYREAAPGQKLSMLQQFVREIGPGAGRTLNRAGGKELREDLILMSLMQRNPGYQQVFNDVLRGRSVIENDPARRPSEVVINQSFAAGIGDAINNLDPNVSRTLNEAAASLYVQRGGRTGTNGVLSQPALYSQSLREVLGGGSNANTGIVNLSQGAAKDWTILPSGVSRTQFENWVDQLAPGDLTRLNRAGLPPVDRTGRPLPLQAIQDEGVFVMVAPGKYGIKLGSDGKWVGQADGNKFIIDLQLSPVR